MNKNNNVKTGYEKFYIKKGTTKLYPFIDFDFVGKHFVCQKCFNTFPSKIAYKDHIGTSICVKNKTYKNLTYLEEKNKMRRRRKFKENENKSVEKKKCSS